MTKGTVLPITFCLRSKISPVAFLLWAIATIPCAALAAASQGNDEDLISIPIERLLNMEVYSASRFVQAVGDAPSAVSVLTAADIKTFGWRTLAEALRSLPGLYTSYDRNYTYLGARGFSRSGDYNPRFLLLIDGNRANDPIYDQATIGSEFTVDVDLIDRIEYVPGPGSSIYGSNAFFGVINVITKRGRDFNGMQVSGEAGSQGARKGRASYGWRDENGAELLLSATSFHQDGKNLSYPEFASHASGGVARGLDYDRGQSVLLKGAAGPFHLSLVHSQRTKGTPTASYEQEFNAPGSKMVDEQTLASVGYRHASSPKDDISTRLFFNQYKYLGDYIYSNAPDVPPRYTNRDEASSNWWGGEIKLVSSRFDRHKLVAGIEYQKSNPVRQDNFDVEPYVSQLNARHQNSRAGIYLQDEWQLRDDLLLSMGLRYDHNSAADSDIVNPRLGAIYRLAPATTVKALFGRAYRLPNAYELYYAIPGSGGQKTNPDLQTERIRSYEMVLEHRLSADSRVRLSTYRNKVTDLITLRKEGPEDMPVYVFRNIDKATATGLEATLEQAWRNGTRLRTSYTWQQTRDDTTGAIMENSPRHLGKLNLSIPFYRNVWRAGFETLYVSSRKTMNSRAGGYALCNLTLFSNRLMKNVELSASIYNLFNRDYADPVGQEFVQEAIAQDGRNARIKLTYNY